MNWRPADGETVTLNPPRMSWFYNAEAPDDFGDAMHMFTLRIADNAEFKDPAVDVVTPFNFYNTLPALDAAETWYWRVGYDVGTESGCWSDTRTFEIADDAEVGDRSELVEPNIESMGHPRVLLRSEMIEEIRALADTHDCTVRVGDHVICFAPNSCAVGEADLLVDHDAFVQRSRDSAITAGRDP